MSFSERTKYLAKSRAAFRCCVCQKPFVEVHHLVPRANGGSNSLSNAAPLCASCHDLYGGNPEKRKALKQMRDSWWATIAERNKKLTDVSDGSPQFEIFPDPNHQGGLMKGRFMLYHRVFANEKFETAASDLVKFVHGAQEHRPNVKRILFLDIDGHRKRGYFDSDMFELQWIFLRKCLLQYVAEIRAPLFHLKNTTMQNNDVPDDLHFLKNLDAKSIRTALDAGVDGVWLGEDGTLLRFSQPVEGKVIPHRPPNVRRRKQRKSHPARA